MIILCFYEVGNGEAIVEDIVIGDVVEIYLGGVDVGVAHSLRDVGKADTSSVGEGCPCMASYIRGEVLREFCPALEALEGEVILGEAMLVRVVGTVIGAQNGEDEVVVGARTIVVHYLLHLRGDGYRDVLVCLMTTIIYEPIADIAPPEVGHIDKGHSEGIDGEEEYIVPQAE